MVAAKNKVELRECVAACVWRWRSVSVSPCVHRDRQWGLSLPVKSAFVLTVISNAGSLKGTCLKIKACPESRACSLIAWLAAQVATWLQHSTPNTRTNAVLICFTSHRKLLPLIQTIISCFNLLYSKHLHSSRS